VAGDGRARSRVYSVPVPGTLNLDSNLCWCLNGDADHDYLAQTLGRVRPLGAIHSRSG
jgi:hypothetical protein